MVNKKPSDGEETVSPDFTSSIRDVEAPSYDACVHAQIEEVKSKKKDRTLEELLMKGEIWEVK